MARPPAQPQIPWLAISVLAQQAARAAVEEQMRLEQAKVRVAVCTPPAALPVVLREVVRRRQHMTEAAAFESVGDDLVAGRWTP